MSTFNHLRPGQSYSPTPTEMELETGQAIFFNEKAGFLLVKHLGSGVEGIASLVRNVTNGELSVRKQDMMITNEYADTGAPPCKEVVNANCARQVEGVAPIRGWIYYDVGAGSGFGVTYWDYYNAGTIGNLIKKSLHGGVDIPERWVCKLVISMIDAILGTHRAGLYHKDPHVHNWFLHRPHPRDDPMIFLGDFGVGVTQTRLMLENDDLDRFNAVSALLQHKDYIKVASVLRALVGHSTMSMSRQYSVVRYIDPFIRPEGDTSLHDLMLIIRQTMLSYLPDAAGPTTEQQEDLARGSTQFDTFWRWKGDDEDEELVNRLRGWRLVTVAKDGGQSKPVHAHLERKCPAIRHVGQGGWVTED